MSESDIRIAIVRLNDSSDSFKVICDDDEVKADDLVVIKGLNDPYKVLSVEMTTLDKLDCEKSTLKSVICKYDESKMTISDILKLNNNQITDGSNAKELERKVLIQVNADNEFSLADYYVDLVKRVQLNLDKTEFAFIKDILILNNSDKDYKNLTLKICFSNKAMTIEDVSIPKIESNVKYRVRVPFMRVDRQLYESVQDLEGSAMKLVLVSSDAEVVAEDEIIFNCLSINQPSHMLYQDYRMYSCYVTPLVHDVKAITIRAAEIYGNLIKGYLNDSYEAKLNEIKAIYEAIHEWGIVYQVAPAGGTHNFQRLRLASDSLKDKKANCIDITLLFASCLEEVGYHPIVVNVYGHAFVGVFLHENTSFNGGLENSLGNLTHLATNGKNEAIFIEGTLVRANCSCSFKEACSEGLKELVEYKNPFLVAVDVNTCRRLGYRSLPNNENDVDFDGLVKPIELRNRNIDNIIDREYIDVSREAHKDKFVFWEKKLLDLTEANPLVVKRASENSNVDVIPINDNFYDILKKNDSIKLLAYKKDKDYSAKVMAEMLQASFKIDVDAYPVVALTDEKILKNLIKKSNSAMDETGAATLYLCMGTLNFKRKKSEERGIAPFMVLPIKLTKDKMAESYTMSYDYENVMLNQTFFEYYTQEHPDVDFSDLYDVGGNDEYLDVVQTFKNKCKADIVLDETAFYFANLTFSHYIMWLDVKKRRHELEKNEIIRSIIEEKSVIEENLIPATDNVDQYENYEDFAAPLYYDSTQLKAILDCGNGKSFILDGPPGTGKSQTIVNMIVNAFYHGKTVLFVAEKKAALDVVFNRLDKISLGRFCLELHSNKANKKDYLERLRASMELGPTKSPEEFKAKCIELDARKQRLVNQVAKMHEYKYFMSLYDAIVKNEELGCYEEFISLPKDFLESYTKEKNQEAMELMDRYIAYANNISNYQGSPLRFVNLTELNFNEQDKVVDLFNSLNKTLDVFIKGYTELTSKLKIKLDLTINNINNIINALDLVYNKGIYADTLAEIRNLKDQLIIQEVFNSVEKLKQLEEQYPNIDFMRAADEDIDGALINLYKQNSFTSPFVKMKYTRRLKAYTRDGKVDKTNLVKIYEAISNYEELYNFLKQHRETLKGIIGNDIIDNRKNIKNIIQRYANSLELLESIKKATTNESYIEVMSSILEANKNSDAIAKMSFNNLFEPYNEMKANLHSLNERFVLDPIILEGDATIEDLRALLAFGAERINFNEMVTCAAMNRIANSISELGFSELIRGVKLNRFSYQDIKKVLGLSLAKGYINLYFADNDINYFVPAEYEREIEKYKSLINEYSNLVIEDVSARLTSKLMHNSIDYAESSPVGRLKKIIGNGGRGVTIRDTLLSFGPIIKSYFPCFLMSPLSAAQYLAVDDESGGALSKFDIVIFDEASQIPTHEAIGPIARGKALIVAGDPQQMPPSAYFSGGIELEGEDVRFEDADSLLEECLAIDLPRHRLSYHYRSKHESLISFSNHNFYNDNLCTFPSPNTANSQVSFRYVEPSSDKNHSDLTRNEVNAILEEFRNIYTNPKTKDKSCGIIVFNLNQSEIVSDAIEKMLQADKELATAVAEASAKTKEGWFVKNLETVQGDERDIIILSINFDKNQRGLASIRGPITNENGEKRLNVAVSRSKEKMIILSTIRYTEFADDSKITSLGTMMLKRFLRFAESSSFKACGNSDGTTKSIVSFIKKRLEMRGYECVTNVGNSEFRVDLAIKNKTGDEYQLGILIDSQGINSNISCRDRIYVQDAVLNGLKWRVIRIYALEYFKDKMATINKIINALDKEIKDEHVEIKPNIEKKQDVSFEYDTIPYIKATNLPSVYYDNDYGFEPRINQLIESIVEVEGPISFDEMKNRIKENSNIKVFKAKAAQRLKDVLESGIVDITNDLNQDFYWPRGKRHELSRFRPADGRDIENISKEEILAAMLQIMKVQQEITTDDLFKFVLRAFEYSQATLNTKNTEKLNYVFSWAKSLVDKK